MSLTLVQDLRPEGGYMFTRSANVARKIGKKLGRHVPSAWGRPTNVQELSRVFIASAPSEHSGCLVSVDPCTLNVDHIIDLPMGATDIAFREDGLGAIACGDTVSIAKVLPGKPANHHNASLGRGELCELCIPSNIDNVVAATADGSIVLLDMNTVAKISDTKVADGAVASVRPSGHSSIVNVCIDTGDSSIFGLFDMRCREMAMLTRTCEAQLNTSAQSGPFVLLGYESGLLEQLDTRSGKIVSSISDPFVSAIGNIEFSTNGDNFVTSGMGDHTLYQAIGGMAQPVTNADGSRKPIVNGNEFWTSSIFLSQSVITSDSHGSVSVSTLE